MQYALKNGLKQVFKLTHQPSKASADLALATSLFDIESYRECNKLILNIINPALEPTYITKKQM